MIQYIAAAALLVAQAGSAESPCITPAEAGDVTVALLPHLVDAAARRCGPHLAAESFLRTGAAPWSARLRRDAEPRREGALRGISKLGGAMAPAGIAASPTFDFIAQMLTHAVSNGIKPENCADIDTLARSLEPLPSDNIASLVGAAINLAMAAGDDDEEGAGEAGAEPGRGAPPFCRS